MTTVPHHRGRVKPTAAHVCAGPRSTVCVFAATVLLLLGCDEERVRGQVVAVVNGEEITVPELNEEARARSLAIGNNQPLRDALVQDMVERKLLVQAAKRRKLDRTPEHLLAQRRSNEILLAGELVAALARQRPDPSDAELAQFISSRPFAFDQRALVSVDRIRAPARLPRDLAQALARAPTLDQAQSLLASRGVQAERRSELWDSATLSGEMARRLLGPAASGTIIFQLPNETIVARVLQAVPEPTPAKDRARFARELVRSEWSRQSVQSLLGQERSQAKIRYQPRFAPPNLQPGG